MDEIVESLEFFDLSNKDHHEGLVKVDTTSTVRTQSFSPGESMETLDLSSNAFDEEFTVCKHVGEGGFSNIELVERNSDKELFIAKFIRKNGVRYFRNEIPYEIDILSRIDHPSIVKVEQYFEQNTVYVMMMKVHGTGKDLFQYLEESVFLSEPTVKTIYKQIVDAVRYLIREMQVIHGDIKDENVIIDSTLNVKLIDFGSALPLTEELDISDFSGTMRNAAPELFVLERYSPYKQEMWSLGTLLYLLLFNQDPVNEEQYVESGVCVINVPPVSEGARRILEGLLEEDPEKRMDIEELCSDEWLQ